MLHDLCDDLPVAAGARQHSSAAAAEEFPVDDRHGKHAVVPEDPDHGIIGQVLPDSGAVVYAEPECEPDQPDQEANRQTRSALLECDFVRGAQLLRDCG